MDKVKDKKILVTGGAGFIGSHLVDELSVENRVTVLDNMSSGSVANLIESQDRISLIEGDILDKALLTDIVGKVEFVFHLAASVGYAKSVEDPDYDMEVNVKGTINLLEACVKSNIKRLVHSSSGAIFGEARYLPIDEDHPLNPESPYGASKLAAEKYCLAFYKIHGLPTTTLRYFNVYGPRQGRSAYPNVIATFFNRIREGNPLTIYGDGKQTRDFVFVKDIVRANILAAIQPAAVGESFNIATGQESSVNQLASIINQISERENEVVYAEHRTGEIEYSRANIKKAQDLLQYNPETDLQEGLLLTWKEEVS